MSESCQAEIAGDFTELVAHLWAHVHAPQPGDAYDPRYIEWARVAIGPADDLMHDAAMIGPRWDPALHLWSELHADIPVYRATASRALADLDASAVGDARILAALQAIDGPVAELVHTTLSLLAPTMQRLFADVMAPELLSGLQAVNAALAMATDVAPGLAERAVALSWVLGPRGRGMPRRIVVGAPASWNDQSPALTAVLALHEHAVVRASATEYVGAEWAALTGNAKSICGASRGLRTAYAQWLGGLDLRALVQAAVTRGWVSAADGEGLVGDSAERLERFAALG